MSSHKPTDLACADMSASPLEEIPKSILPPDRIDRLARAIANGSAPLPQNTDAQTRVELLQRVNRMRHARFVSFLARVIAEEIFRSRQ